MNDPAVSLQGISKQFPKQKSKAIDGITTDIPQGKIVGVVGPDGAGKTTLIRIIIGLLTPSKGTVRLFGAERSAEMLEYISYMPQQFALYEDLTVIQNLNLYAKLRGVSPHEQEEILDNLLTLSRLAPFKDRLAKNLSGGMKQKLSLISTLMQQPRLLILDEPTVGLDPVARREIWAMIQPFISKGLSVIWATCYLDEAEKFDELLLLNRGKLLLHSRPNLLKEQMIGRAFHIKNISTSLKQVLSKCMASPLIMDSTAQGGSVRILLKEKERCPPLSDLHAGEKAYYEAAVPRFEDVFIEKLGGVPNEISPLSAKMPRFPDDSKIMIQAQEVTKKFGNFTAANAISFSVRRGEIFGLLGPNGAGKSTTFRILCGLIKPTEGKAFVNGVPFEDAPGFARSNIGYVAQKFSLYSNISVKQNLNFFFGIYSTKPKNRKRMIDAMVSIFAFEPYINTIAEELPLGYKQRLALACALMHQPQVLFLDEATSGVDPVTRREFWNHINGMVEKGTTVLITTHYMDEAEYCDRIGFLNNGKLVAMGSPDELKAKVQSPSLPNPSIEDAFVLLCGGNGDD